MTAVLVIGAGPVGLTMAVELQRYGVDFRIVEKAAERTDKSKALVVWSRTLELLERCGLAGEFVAAGRRVVAANFFADGKRLGHIGLTEVDTSYAYALVLPQSETERLLETALARRGRKVERGVEVSDLTAENDGATVTLRHGDGRSERARFDWIIGCDGAHSLVRHTLGPSFTGETLDSDWILADVHLENFPVPETELALYWHEDGPLAVFPMTPGRFRVVAVLGRAKEAAPHRPSLEDVQQVVDRRGPGGVTVSDPTWLSGFRINDRKVRDYRNGRLFLAGDAAHVHSPAGGQGMNTGMQDAFNLAWKLALVVRGAVPDGRLLDSYSAERSAVGDKVLAEAARLTALVTLRSHAAQSIRNMVGGLLLGLAPVRRHMAQDLTEIAIGYSESPLNGPQSGDGPAPGARVRPIPGHAPFGAGDFPRFALCAALDGAVEEIAHRHPALVAGAIRPPLAASGVHLVRPDGYVAASCATGEEHRLDAYLRTLGKVE
jgi:2-polyprenyl-6-methoxyphenol hydroxylase-like FAD-dependent oxidoreductase